MILVIPRHARGPAARWHEPEDERAPRQRVARAGGREVEAPPSGGIPVRDDAHHAALRARTLVAGDHFRQVPGVIPARAPRYARRPSAGERRTALALVNTVSDYQPPSSNRKRSGETPRSVVEASRPRTRRARPPHCLARPRIRPGAPLHARTGEHGRLDIAVKGDARSSCQPRTRRSRCLATQRPARASTA